MIYATESEVRRIGLETLASTRRYIRALRSAEAHPEGSSLVRAATLHQQSLTAMVDLIVVVDGVLRRWGYPEFDAAAATLRAARTLVTVLYDALGSPEEAYERATFLNRESLKAMDSLSVILRPLLNDSDENFVHNFPDGSLERPRFVRQTGECAGDSQGNNRLCECS